MLIWTVRKHLSYLILVFVLYALLSVGNAAVYNWYEIPFSNFSDLTIHIPRALKLNDPSLFQRDPVFTLPYTRLDSIVFAWYLGKALPVFGVRGTLILFSTILGLVFVVGIYVLTNYLSGNPLAGVLAAFLASLSYKALGWVQLGFTPEIVLPRNFIVAVSPILIVLFFHWRTGKWLWIVFALVGLMANFHMLAALHLVFIFALTLIFTSKPSWSLLKQIIVAGCASLITALPSAIFFLPSLSEVTMVTPDEAAVVLTRFAETINPRGVDILLFSINFLPLAFFGALGFYQAFKQEKHWDIMRVYLTLYIIVLLLPWVGRVINNFTLSVTQLEMLRITRYYFMLSFPPVGILLASWLQARQRIPRLSSVFILFAVIILSRYAVGAAIVLEGYDWLFPTDSTIAQTDSEYDSLELIEDWQAFSDLTSWIDANTPIDAVFITPVKWGQFWTYARRAVVVNDRGAFWPGWAEHYETVQNLYDRPNADRFIDVARSYEADYVIVMSGLTLPGMNMVYENEHYVVYKVN